MPTGKTLARRSRQCGFTYIGILLVIALLGTGLGLAGELWQTTVKRSKEAELIFIGDEFKRAIQRYYQASPTAARQWPRTLEDLLHDKRHPTVVRHLRKIYVDPMTGKAEWGVVPITNGIAGVHSLSRGTPLKRRGAATTMPENSKHYSDWKFIAEIDR